MSELEYSCLKTFFSGLMTGLLIWVLFPRKAAEPAKSFEPDPAINPCSDFPPEGTKILVRLNGDSVWFHGIALDRPRKKWIEIQGYYEDVKFIADENSIAEWKLQ